MIPSPAICRSCRPRSVPCAAADRICSSGSFIRITATCATETGITKASASTASPRTAPGAFQKRMRSQRPARGAARIFTTARRADTTGGTTPPVRRRFGWRCRNARRAGPRPSRSPRRRSQSPSSCCRCRLAGRSVDVSFRWRVRWALPRRFSSRFRSCTQATCPFCARQSTAAGPPRKQRPLNLRLRRSRHRPPLRRRARRIGSCRRPRPRHRQLPLPSHRPSRALRSLLRRCRRQRYREWRSVASHPARVPANSAPFKRLSSGLPTRVRLSSAPRRHGQPGSALRKLGLPNSAPRTRGRPSSMPPTRGQPSSGTQVERTRRAGISWRQRRRSAPRWPRRPPPRRTRPHRLPTRAPFGRLPWS